MVVTDIASASNVIKWPGPNRSEKIYFYLNELEWLKLRNSIPYEQMAKIYLHPKISIIAPSQTYKEIFEMSWRDTCGVVENGNVEELVKLIFP